MVVNQPRAHSRAICQLGSGDPYRETMNWPLRNVQPVELDKF